LKDKYIFVIILRFVLSINLRGSCGVIEVDGFEDLLVGVQASR